MDLRLGPPSRAHIVPRRGERLRAVVGQTMSQAMGRAKERAIGEAKDRAPRAEAAAARCIECTRPVWSWLALEWRRLGTGAALFIIVGLLLHAMYGANGMSVYREKRAELQSLRSEVERLQKENDQHVDQIRSLKSDPAAIEKEAREQLRYARPGEVVLVPPDLPQKPASGRAKNEAKN